MMVISKLKTPKQIKTVQKMNKTHLNGAKSNSLRGAGKRPQGGPVNAQLNTLVKEYPSKDVLSKDKTSDFLESKVKTKTPESCNSCTDLKIPLIKTPLEAHASPTDNENIPLTCLEENVAPQGADETSPAMGSLEAALAATKNKSQSSLEKSAESIFTKTTRKNVEASWKLLVPSYGHKSRIDALDDKSWYSLIRSDKSMKNDARMFETELFANIPDVMEWSLKVWTTVLQEEFKWTQEYNTLAIEHSPSLSFFCRNYKKLAELFDKTHAHIARKDAGISREVMEGAMSDYKSGLDLRLQISDMRRVSADTDRLVEKQAREIKVLTEALMNPIAPVVERIKTDAEVEAEFQEALAWECPEWGDVSSEVEAANQAKSKKRQAIRERIAKLREQA